MIDLKQYKFYSRVTIGLMIIGLVIQVLAFFEDGIRFTIIGSVVVGVGLAFYIIFLRKLEKVA